MKRLIKTLAVLGILALLGIFSIFGMIAYIYNDLPQINTLKDYNPPMNSKILSKDNEVLLEIGTETREVVAFENIPKEIVDAFLAAEDDNFYHHEGIDYYGILRAFIVNLKEGRLVQGGSTITQQVAKSFLLTKERTISRKIKDLLLARKIEQKFSKDEILFLYLNQVYLGGGYYGVKAAFKGYFDKELEEASPAEAALVAGLLVAPGRYSPYVNPRYAKFRQSYVLKRMYETKKITEEEYKEALAENIRMRIRVPNEFKGGHFTDWIRQEVSKTVGSDEFLTNGFTVQTTLDWSLQQKAEKIVLEKVKDLDKRQGFKGAIRSLEEDKILDFIKEQRKKTLKNESSYFTFTTEGKNIYEFHEEDEDFAKILESYEVEKTKIPEKFRSLVDIGNHTDQKRSFLEINKSYQGVVIGVDDAKRIIVVQVAGSRVIIPEEGFAWAHERSISENPTYFAKVKNPTKIVKVGNIILVNIKSKNAPLNTLLSDDFKKKNSDPKLVSHLAKQKFYVGELDQDPEAEGALIAIHPVSGEIISMVGGISFQKSQFNRVIQSSRQPGSAFKPFIYAASLENGYNPSSILMDTPQALAGVDNSLSWKPRNYDGSFNGPMTLRHALEVSRNIPTIRLVQDLGVEKIRQFVNRIHMQTDLPKDMSLSLGSFGVSLAELTKGFAIFPNGGKAIRLKHITSIKDRYGNSHTIPEADAAWPEPTEKTSVTPEPIPVVAEATEDGVVEPEKFVNPFLTNLNRTQVLDPRVAFIMTNLLRGVALYGTASGAGKALGGNVGGKTGTTNNYVDALFVGFSSNAVVGSWAGFDDNRSLGFAETGGRSALPMWIDYMKELTEKYGTGEFKVPEGIVNILVNKQTGKPIPPGSSDGFLESFAEGFDPNSAPAVFDQSTQPSGDNPPTIDDDDFFMNQ